MASLASGQKWRLAHVFKNQESSLKHRGQSFTDSSNFEIGSLLRQSAPAFVPSIPFFRIMFTSAEQETLEVWRSPMRFQAVDYLLSVDFCLRCHPGKGTGQVPSSSLRSSLQAAWLSSGVRVAFHKRWNSCPALSLPWMRGQYSLHERRGLVTSRLQLSVPPLRLTPERERIRLRIVLRVAIELLSCRGAALVSFPRWRWPKTVALARRVLMQVFLCRCV